MNKKPVKLIGEDSQELKNLLSTTINSLSEWIHVVDSNLDVILINDAYKGMMKSLGFKDNLNKKKLKEVFPFLSKKVISEYQKVFKTGQILATQDVNEFDGRKIYTEVIKEPVFENNKVVRVVTVIRDISKRIQREKEIMESQKQLKIFASHLHTIREEERVEIARELHDHLGQNLTALRFDISRLIGKLKKSNEKQDIRSLVSQAVEVKSLVDLTIQQVRRIYIELRPQILAEFGLISAIEWQIDEFMKRTGIPCTIHYDNQVIEIGSENNIAVFRIFQESLTNIIRHANATHVTISIRKCNQSFILQIEDNGSGIKKSNLTNVRTPGLIGMHERAILAGGTLTIKGEKGKGTKVTLFIPLKSNMINKD